MTVRIRMREWKEIVPAQNSELAGASFGNDSQARSIADQLAQAGVLEVIELRSGLSIRSTSYVGRIQIGSFEITIQPKIKHDILLTLFRYAYNLRDLHLVTYTDLDAEPDAFQDMLIEQLAAEVSELIARGLHRQYRRIDEDLTVPKGRIDLQQIAKRGGLLEASIPITHYPRLEDSLVNQVLLEGLLFAATLTSDLVTRSRLRRLAGIIQIDVARIRLDLHALRRLRREMSRLTSHYEPSILLIELLLRSTGITLEEKAESVRLPGFLFDMNRFFERLLSRFFKENLPDYVVHDQYRLTGMMSYVPDQNPNGRQAPSPRPDFVVTQGGKTKAILDAKYRDLWEKPLPRDMLYQLAIYALSQGWNGQSTILYPSIGTDTQPQAIEIRAPLSGPNSARVILRPVDLNSLSDVLRETRIDTRRKCELFARQLAFGDRRL